MNERLLRALESGKNLDSAIEEAAAPMRKAIGRMLEAKPFVPFRLSMTDRHVLEIRTPEGVSLRSSVMQIDKPDPATGAMKWHCTLALAHVVTLQPLFADEPVVVQRPQSESK